MIKRILVPLDGRESSERVLPVIAALARDGAAIRFLRVFPVPDRIVGPGNRTIAYVDQEMARLTGIGLAELRPAETRLSEIPSEKIVRFGDPDAEILLEAEAFGADLIVLSAKARGRLMRGIAPGIADRVARRATIPTLVLKQPIRG